MAFGSSASKTKKQSAQNTHEGKPVFDNAQIPLTSTSEKNLRQTKGGDRYFRMLPRLDAAGQIITINGMEDTEAEVPFISLWLPVKHKGSMVQRRIIMDVSRQFDNPYWNLVAKDTPRGSDERRAQKLFFALAVLDRSRAIRNETGQLVYPNESGEFTVLSTGRYIDPVQSPAAQIQPVNRMAVLEGSWGELDGKTLFANIVRAISSYDTEDGSPLVQHHVDLKIKIDGYGLKTSRMVSVVPRKIDTSLFFLPRYNIKAMYAPWPDEAVKALILGAEYTDVLADFKISTLPFKDGEDPVYWRKADPEDGTDGSVGEVKVVEIPPTITSVSDDEDLFS